MNTIVHAPHPMPALPVASVFLAGSIEMGKAEDWQTRLIAELSSFDNLTIFNPRRPDWDSSWKQSIDDPQFFQQVEWELDHLSRADVIALYLSPGTQSPISLMELGLHVFGKRSLIVCCPEGFWRKGNVDIVCQHYGVPCTDNWDEFVRMVRRRLAHVSHKL